MRDFLAERANRATRGQPSPPGPRRADQPLIALDRLGREAGPLQGASECESLRGVHRETIRERRPPHAPVASVEPRAVAAVANHPCRADRQTRMCRLLVPTDAPSLLGDVPPRHVVGGQALTSLDAGEVDGAHHATPQSRQTSFNVRRSRLIRSCQSAHQSHLAKAGITSSPPRSATAPQRDP